MAKRLIFTILLILVTCIGIAHAKDRDDDNGPQKISGDYRVAITQICVRTPYQPPPATGFDPNTQQLLVDGETVTAIGSGLLRFGDNGTVQILDAVQTEISLGQTAAGKTPVAPPTQFSCTGRYTIDQRKVTVAVGCDVNVPQPGVTVHVGPQNFEGYIDAPNQSVNLTSLGGIQTVTVSFGGSPIQQRQRVCTQQVSGAKDPGSEISGH